MKTSTSEYAGDARLAELLAQNDVNTSMASLRDLIRGVLAAPQTRNLDAWHVLVTPTAEPELAQQLNALKSTLAVENDAAADLAQTERVPAIRAQMRSLGIDAFLIPRADEHQGEYVPLRAERLFWSTGFTGSAGAAVIMTERAAIFVDGRYTLQAKTQVDAEVFEQQDLHATPPAKWLRQALSAGQRVGYDPWLHTVSDTRKLRAACKKAGAELVSVANPVDAAWDVQPPAPIGVVSVHSDVLAGQRSEEKRAALAEALEADAAVITTPDSIAWLLNIRGCDVPRTPLPLSFAVLNADASVDLFIEPRKLGPGVTAHLGESVRVHAPGALGAVLDGFDQKSVMLDGAWAADWIATRLKSAGATVTLGADPCLLPKACKNAVELNGIRAAHRRDGAALTRFLRWIELSAQDGTVTELDAVDKLYAFRAEDESLRDLSFDTISGAGPNGAIVHYRVTEETNRALEPGNLYLVDSGGQYPDGTTDVTRTVAIGTPTAEMRDRFTRVLKGHIQLGSARFAPGTTGAQLDALARLPLWSVGLDYDHGTGHGVGAYLAVHEGPQRISKAGSTVALLPGMVVSNEPGYYKTDGYGIRIENLVAVRGPEQVGGGGERAMHAFETLTLAPIDRNLVAVELLDDAELGWLNGYHQRVVDTLTPLLDGETNDWLSRACAPLDRT